MDLRLNKQTLTKLMPLARKYNLTPIKLIQMLIEQESINVKIRGKYHED